MAYKEEFIDVRGSRMQLLRGGAGDPVLYLHGAGGEVAWLPFFEQLSRDFTVYLPAHPGFSRSDGLEKIDTIEDLAFHYIDVMDALKLERPLVVGLSLGGWLEAELAIRYPQRMRKLVLIDAVGLRVENAPIADIFAPTPPELRRLIFYQPDSELAKTFVPDAPSSEALEMILRAREATARVGWNPFLYDPKLRDRLKHAIDLLGHDKRW